MPPNYTVCRGGSALEGEDILAAHIGDVISGEGKDGKNIYVEK
jgi:hypothetical protein